ncbi:lymphocyte antigen 6 complex locus protein G6f [Emydura macquarii macquarii]|uniref:lymphocyte antigen 6 complex locus protein G6f n=1 Tax=Emydura macquarii macquarii TaxID=1129001 RepID=UPI00352B0CDD
MAPVWILLLLQLQLTAEEAAYVQKGHTRELPCSLEQPLAGQDELVWSYHAGGTRESVTLFRAVAGRVQANVSARLALLPNFSLQLSGAEDNDTGTYWCTVRGANQRSYELAVVTGTRTALADPACQLFSCALSAPLERAALTWWDNRHQVQDANGQGRLRLFWGHRAGLLQACWRKRGGGEPRAGARPGQLRCQLKDTVVTFDLAGAAKEPPIRARGGSACGSAWMPLAAGVALEFLLILALGVALWRQRRPNQGLELGGHLACPTPGPPGPKSQLYENVGLDQCPTPASLPP